MTKLQLIESLLDYIINLMVTNSSDFDNFDVNRIRRIFGSQGTLEETDINNVDTLSDIVVYSEDYQQGLTPTSFDETLQAITECQYDSTTDSYIDWSDAFEFFVTYNSSYDDLEELDSDNNIPNITISMTNCAPPNDVPFNIPLTESFFTFLANFINFNNENYVIDIEKAKQILDTEIFELIPTSTTRQTRINKFFTEYEALKGIIPDYNLDVDSDEIPDTWSDSVESNQDIHHNNTGIKPSQNPNVGDIVRLDRHAEGTLNEGQTLQSLRDDLNLYLTDIDKVKDIEPTDERPEYEPQSSGYMRINGLNQGIIIKQEDTDISELIGNDEYNPNWLTQGFSIAMWVKFLNKSNSGTLFNLGNPFYGYSENGENATWQNLGFIPGKASPGQIKPAFALQTFTINKNDAVDPRLSVETLANNDSTNVYWNYEEERPITWGEYVKNEYSKDGNGLDRTINRFANNQPLFVDSDNERFIRLIVRDQYGSFWDSHTGKSKSENGWNSQRLTNRAVNYGFDMPGTISDEPPGGYLINDDPTPNGPDDCKFSVGCYSDLISHSSIKPFRDSFPYKIIDYLHVPSNLTEWYYIVANWYPDIKENNMAGDCPATGTDCAPSGYVSLKFNEDYWKWHVTPEGIQATDADFSSNENLRVGTEDNPCEENGGEGVNPDYPYCYKDIGKYTHNSGEGAKCKVELISRSDLLRAKGFKV